MVEPGPGQGRLTWFVVVAPHLAHSQTWRSAPYSVAQAPEMRAKRSSKCFVHCGIPHQQDRMCQTNSGSFWAVQEARNGTEVPLLNTPSQGDGQLSGPDARKNAPGTGVCQLPSLLGPPKVMDSASTALDQWNTSAGMTHLCKIEANGRMLLDTLSEKDTLSRKQTSTPPPALDRPSRANLVAQHQFSASWGE